MSLVDCKVEIGLNAFQYTGGNFVLDSSSLGLLGTSKLSGLEWYDVSEYVQQVQIRRGRSRQLDYFNAGVATVNFNNMDRVFDPLNTASPFYPGISPRCLMRISSYGYWLFTGFVNDWDLEYDISGRDSATASCSDAFAVLANQLLSAFTPTSQLTGARIETVLNRSEVGYRGGREIAAGVSTLGAYAVSANTNVLNYLRQIERSELGSLFVASNGDIVFRSRGQAKSNEIVEFSDNGSGVPYQTLDNMYGDELLYNYVRAQSPAGAEQVASDSTSITEYQVSQVEFTDLLNSSTTEVSSIAKIILGQYKMPKVRFTGFSVQILGLSETQIDQVLMLDLTDYVNLNKSFDVGSPSTFTQPSVLTGISHEIRPGSHRVSFTVENAEAYMFLILGDSFAGQLDFGLLDF